MRNDGRKGTHSSTLYSGLVALMLGGFTVVVISTAICEKYSMLTGSPGSSSQRKVPREETPICCSGSPCANERFENGRERGGDRAEGGVGNRYPATCSPAENPSKRRPPERDSGRRT